MDYIQAVVQQMTDQREQFVKEQMQREERKIIKGFAAEGKIKPYGMNSVIHAIRTAKTMGQNWQQGLMIANAATAAAIRKNFTREEVEIIVTAAVETGIAYAVTDEELKSQLLASIKNRGY